MFSKKIMHKYNVIIFLFLGKSLSPSWRNFTSGSHTENSQTNYS